MLYQLSYIGPFRKSKLEIRNLSNRAHNVVCASFEFPFSSFELERETGIEPATNSLEGCDSTTELLPPPTWKPETRKSKLVIQRLSPADEVALSFEPGGQGRIRTSVDRMGRQIYSLLLLTAQPPVRIRF